MVERKPTTVSLTFIELGVVLAVFVTLALLVTPTIINFATDSREARARAEVQAIADALIHFYGDNGFFPQWSKAENGGPGLAASYVDLLVSSGNVPGVAQPNLWTAGTTDQLGNQLISNAAGYSLRTVMSRFGWNGPYMASSIGPDPWKNRYMVNIGEIGASLSTQPEDRAVRNAVWVISAGPNGRIETAPTQSIAAAALSGDDIGVLVP